MANIVLMCCEIALGVLCLLCANHNAVNGNKVLARWDYCFGALDFFFAGVLFERILNG